MVYSTFSSIMTARSGIVASQLGLNITGQNMSNVNTPGYSRQRLDLVSVGASTYTSRVATYGIRVGGGVNANGVTQLRDQYLDNRFRTEHANLGELSAEYSVLDQLENMFNEFNMSGITDRFSEFFLALQNLNNKKTDEFDNLARTEAELLVNLLHSYASQFSAMREAENYQLQSVHIPRINEIFAQLSEVNINIQDAQAVGGDALELKDARNTLLDELSQYMDIKVTYSTSTRNKNMEDITIELNLPGAANITLMENGDYKKFSVDASTGKTRISVDGTDVTEDLATGYLKGMLDMLNKGGEFENPPYDDVRGIAYYEGMLNTLVDTFAKLMNGINGDPLFETNDLGADFTIGNIKIVDAWRDDADYGINRDNENIAALISAMKDPQQYTYPGSSVVYFEGSIYEYFNEFSNQLSGHASSVKTLTENKSSVVNDIDLSRLAVSAVSMDEETVNLIMYQKSYNAASRLMTVLDEALDQLINKTGVIGR